MIPVFPHFKPLEISDQRLIDKRNVKGYSDFSFISLWCWNTRNDFSISLLNNNLVVKMRDYISHKPILTFLGNNNLDDTIENLLHASNSIGKNKLYLIPEDNINGDKKALDNYVLTLDRDQFDYIYNIEELSLLKGNKYHKKRNLAQKFEKKYKHEVKILNLKSRHNQRSILYLWHMWLDKKNKRYIDYRDEFMAVQKIFILKNILSVGVFVEDELVGFNIGELYPNKYCMILFQKYNPFYTGVSEYLMKKTCGIYNSKGAEYLNFMQDVGVPGLRDAKKLWRPVKFLKKYKIRRKSYTGLKTLSLLKIF